MSASGGSPGPGAAPGDVFRGPWDVAFLCTWPVAFHGGSLAERPLGGSETAVIEVARRIAQRGLRVAVFCPLPAGCDGGRWDGVTYADRVPAEAALAAGSLAVGTLVVLRDPTRAHLGRHARRTLLWLQDMPMEGLRRQHREALPFVERFLAVSRFQRDRFVERYDLPPERFLVTRNGVDAARYRRAVAVGDGEGAGAGAGPGAGEGAGHGPPRDPARLVYLSTPFRGLGVLLDAFPAIRAAVPPATLHVWSGMAAYDQPDDPFRPLYERAAALPGVVRHEPVPQQALVPALQAAALMVYPATFSETSCIAAMMAIAAGVPVVASDRAGLPETIGDCGVLVRGNARRDPTYPARFAAAVVALLQDAAARRALEARCAARELDWEPVVDEWWPHIRTHASDRSGR